MVRHRLIAVDFLLAATSGYLLGDFFYHRIPLLIENAELSASSYVVQLYIGAVLGVLSLALLNKDVKEFKS